MAVENENDLLWVYNPTVELFTVKWGGYPYSLKSGEKRVYPRFIATHFAKHLADAILLRREQKQFENTGKVVSYITNPVERPKVVNMILLGVYSYHRPQADPEGDQIAKIVAQAQAAVPADTQAPQAPVDTEVYDDYGFVPDKAIGTLSAPAAAPPADIAEEPVADQPQVIENKGDLIGDAAPAPKKQRTKKELQDEAAALDIALTGKETVDQLEEKIRAF